MTEQIVGLNTWIIIVTYNHRAYLPALFESLARLTHPRFHILVIDNGSSDGTPAVLRSLSQSVEVIYQESNTGFCDANNRGMAHAFAAGADACLLLNPDTEVTPDFLSLLETSYQEQLQKGVQVGLLQPVILHRRQPDLLNTAGNAMHYLGFGWCKDNLSPKPVYDHDPEIGSVSGACLYMPKLYYQQVGGFNSAFFAYSEDQDVSWRGLLQNYRHFCASKAVIYHDYHFSKSTAKWYHAEKNRLMVVLQNYEFRTLLVLGPSLVGIELLILLYSLAGGFFTEKLKGYRFLVQHRKHIRRVRNQVQAKRTVSDAAIWNRFSDELVFSEIKNPLLTWIVNPVLRGYFALVRRLL
ncbi:glycosyltransferase family 2 protein [Larkinella punicea]|uniref:Glycosyltransferase family 2 protein n=1 Tax=Larkinella punicea TaxID=2315727 RepID=A0A368JK71_9BACT|nr:glycosyltransferase family 2 protein [Larkinella punicea]RCR68067.1 glycosyltransferase family 2 protein [Larkinella punicea]